MTGDVPHLLLEPRERLSWRRVAAIGAVSVVVNLALLTGLAELPAGPGFVPGAAEEFAALRQAVHIYAPPPERKPPEPPKPTKELTQKAPNKGVVSHEIDVRSSVEASHSQAPQAPAAPPPGAPTPPPPPPEPPKIEVAAVPPPPKGDAPTLAPPSQGKAVEKGPEKPKLAFESIGGGGTPTGTAKSAIEIPKMQASLDAAARAVARDPGAGGQTVGDIGVSSARAPGAQGAPAAGPLGSSLQLLSDAQNIDFKPYLLQVLALVRKNWFAVIPESARLGTRRGTTVLQFIVDRKGAVPKLVIATQSGTEAFDRAAVAGVSASYPFPPLPAEFKGTDIRLQMAFAYNMNR